MLSVACILSIISIRYRKYSNSSKVFIKNVVHSVATKPSSAACAIPSMLSDLKNRIQMFDKKCRLAIFMISVNITQHM